MSVILDDLTTGLNIIATIKRGQTLSKRYNKLVVIDHTQAEGVYRTLWKEDRYTTRDLIRDIVLKSFELSDLLLDSKYLTPTDVYNALHIQKYADIHHGLTILHKSLTNSIEGIKQTSETYKSDESLLQEYNTLVKKIEYHVSIIDHHLRSLKK
jgi:hypothetical protein